MDLNRKRRSNGMRGSVGEKQRHSTFSHVIIAVSAVKM